MATLVTSNDTPALALSVEFAPNLLLSSWKHCTVFGFFCVVKSMWIIIARRGHLQLWPPCLNEKKRKKSITVWQISAGKSPHKLKVMKDGESFNSAELSAKTAGAGKWWLPSEFGLIWLIWSPVWKSVFFFKLFVLPGKSQKKKWWEGSPTGCKGGWFGAPWGNCKAWTITNLTKVESVSLRCVCPENGLKLNNSEQEN